MTRKHIAFWWSLALVCSVATFSLGPIAVSAQEIRVYDGKFFPFAIIYDGDIWGNRSTTSFETNERLEVRAGATVFFLEAFPSQGQTAEECIDVAIRSVRQVETVENLAENDQLPLPDGPAAGEEVLLTYHFTPEGRESAVLMVQYVHCQELDSESFLLMGIETRAGIYEEELEIINGILAGVEIVDQSS